MLFKSHLLLIFLVTNLNITSVVGQVNEDDCSNDAGKEQNKLAIIYINGHEDTQRESGLVIQEITKLTKRKNGYIQGEVKPSEVCVTYAYNQKNDYSEYIETVGLALESQMNENNEPFDWRMLSVLMYTKKDVLEDALRDVLEDSSLKAILKLIFPNKVVKILSIIKKFIVEIKNPQDVLRFQNLTNSNELAIVNKVTPIVENLPTILISNQQGTLFSERVYRRIKSNFEVQSPLNVLDMTDKLVSLFISPLVLKENLDPSAAFEYMRTDIDKSSRLLFLAAAFRKEFFDESRMLDVNLPLTNKVIDPNDSNSYSGMYSYMDPLTRALDQDFFPKSPDQILIDSFYARIDALAEVLFGLRVQDCNLDGKKGDIAFINDYGGYIEGESNEIDENEKPKYPASKITHAATDDTPGFELKDGARLCGGSKIDAWYGEVSGSNTVIDGQSIIGDKCEYFGVTVNHVDRFGKIVEEDNPKIVIKNSKFCKREVKDKSGATIPRIGVNAILVSLDEQYIETSTNSPFWEIAGNDLRINREKTSLVIENVDVATIDFYAENPRFKNLFISNSEEVVIVNSQINNKKKIEDILQPVTISGRVALFNSKIEDSNILASNNFDQATGLTSNITIDGATIANYSNLSNYGLITGVLPSPFSQTIEKPLVVSMWDNPKTPTLNNVTLNGERESIGGTVFQSRIGGYWPSNIESFEFINEINKSTFSGIFNLSALKIDESIIKNNVTGAGAKITNKSILGNDEFFVKSGGAMTPLGTCGEIIETTMSLLNASSSLNCSGGSSQVINSKILIGSNVSLDNGKIINYVSTENPMSNVQNFGIIDSATFVSGFGGNITNYGTISGLGTNVKGSVFVGHNATVTGGATIDGNSTVTAGTFFGGQGAIAIGNTYIDGSGCSRDLFNETCINGEVSKTGM